MKIHIDKNSAKHFSICFSLALILGVFGAGVAAGAGITKEWYDRQTYGHWCWIDLLFDGLGLATGLTLHILIIKWLI